jgi:predicted nucleic acid-binding protein
LPFGTAATALGANLPLYTRNIDDFRGIEHLVVVVGVYPS